MMRFVRAAQPSFLMTPQDQVVSVGRRVIMRCQVTGNPVPAVFWNKQSSQVALINRLFTSCCYSVHEICF